jgi:hypothetical protein
MAKVAIFVAGVVVGFLSYELWIRWVFRKFPF